MDVLEADGKRWREAKYTDVRETPEKTYPWILTRRQESVGAAKYQESQRFAWTDAG